MKEKLAELLNVTFGFRKFLLMILLLIIGVVFRIKGYVNGAEMVDLFKSTAISFFAANGVEHIVTCIKDYNAGNVTKALGNQGDDTLVPASEIDTGSK